MRIILVLLATTALAACGGSDGGSAITSVGSAAPASSGSSTSTTDKYAQFANQTVAKTYVGLGGLQSITYTVRQSTTAPIPGVAATATTPAVAPVVPVAIAGPYDGYTHDAEFYAGNAAIVNSPNVTITYDPTSAIFTLNASDTKANTSANNTFQDPAHRVAGSTIQWGIPQFKQPNTDPVTGPLDQNLYFVQAVNGTQSATSTDVTTFFYQKPGSTTQYLTLAGYVRNAQTTSVGVADPSGNYYTSTANKLERGAFVYGVPTDTSGVPVTGTATYNGNFLATAVINPNVDGVNSAGTSAQGTPTPSYFQWIYGNAATTVDFGKSTIGVQLNGITYAAMPDPASASAISLTPPPAQAVSGGAAFSATAAGSLVKGGNGFTGTFSAASFGATATSSAVNVSIANVSSLNGQFYGPAANEVGGAFRIVGSVPNQRVDILGAFTGK